jgi:aspartyl protease family protein
MHYVDWVLTGRSLRGIFRSVIVPGIAGLATCCAIVSAQAQNKISVIGLFKDKAIVEIDGVRRVLNTGATSPEGVRLLGADSKGAVMVIDGQEQRFVLGSKIIAGTASPSATKATVKIWPDPAGMYLVNGSINQFPVKFLVDTGATLVAMNEVEAKRIGIPYKLKGQLGQSSTASGIAKTYYIRLAKVRVGDIELTDVDGAILEGGYPIEVLLGNSFLSRLNMVRSGQMMELQSKR